MKVRTLIKSCVSLALIPPEDVIMGFDQVCSASESFPQIKCYLEYFEETWRAGEVLPVNAKVERHRQRLQQLLNHYQNNNLLSVLEGLSITFDF